MQFTMHSMQSTWPVMAKGWPARFQGEKRRGWHWPGRSSQDRRSFFLTSLPLISTLFPQRKSNSLCLKSTVNLDTTIVISTHDMLQGQKLASRIGVILEGGIPQIGTTNEIFHRPATRNIARFVRVENIVPGVVTGNRDGEASIAIPGITIQAITDTRPGNRVIAVFRAEDVTIHTERLSNTSARNVFRGKIKSMASQGPFVDVVVDCGIDITSLVTVSSAEDLGLGFGKEVWISFKATAIHVIPDS